MPPRKRARKGQARGQAKQNQQQTAANEPCPQPGATGTPEIVRLCGDGGVQQSVTKCHTHLRLMLQGPVC